jgi:hypothetical protein
VNEDTTIRMMDERSFYGMKGKKKNRQERKKERREEKKRRRKRKETLERQ